MVWTLIESELAGLASASAPKKSMYPHVKIEASKLLLRKRYEEPKGEYNEVARNRRQMRMGPRELDPGKS
jgi:hypothetical protein